VGDTVPAVDAGHDLLLGRYASVVLGSQAPPGMADRVWRQAAREPLLGEWAPDREPPAPGPCDGIIVAASDASPVGLVRGFDAPDVPGARLLSLFLADRTAGTAFFLEGALRYCLWHFTELGGPLHAQVLSDNRRMLTLLGKLGIEPEATLRRARYCDGGWHDLLVFTISPASLRPCVDRYRAMLRLP
jgi:RimJ/RimL family protein N-acetyltransferase